MTDALPNVEHYFRHVGASLDCPFCHAPDWDMEVWQGEWMVTRLSRRTPNTDWQDRPVLALTCARCGYLRLQDFRPILAWLQSPEGVS